VFVLNLAEAISFHKQICGRVDASDGMILEEVGNNVRVNYKPAHAAGTVLLDLV